MTAPSGAQSVGSLAEEAGQLLDAVTVRLNRWKAEAALEPVGAPTPSAAPTAHSCVGWCPICRGAEVLRGDRSEVGEKLLDTALLLLTTLRSLIPEPPSAATAPGFETSTTAARPGVERIDIR